MITAVDTSVLLDVFGADPVFGVRSARALRACLQEGKLVACDVVWAETGVFFETIGAARGAMERLGVAFSPLDAESALAASASWREYRRQGGRRERVAADFLVGAHALHHADRLLTRDRGYYRAYFAGLRIIEPAAD